MNAKSRLYPKTNAQNSEQENKTFESWRERSVAAKVGEKYSK